MNPDQIEAIKKWAKGIAFDYSNPESPTVFWGGQFTYHTGRELLKVYIDSKRNVTKIVLPNGAAVQLRENR